MSYQLFLRSSYRQNGLAWMRSGRECASFLNKPPSLFRPFSVTVNSQNSLVQSSCIRLSMTPAAQRLTVQTSRCYHATALNLQAVRRRRKRNVTASRQLEEDETSNSEKKDGSSSSVSSSRKTIRRITDPEAFDTVSTELLDTIYAALKPLQEINDPFFLSRDTEWDMGDYILLDLGPLHGQYTIQIDKEQALVHMQSPISGIVQYYKDADDGEWRSVDDGHILQGLLVRDLIRQIKGVPKL